MVLELSLPKPGGMCYRHKLTGLIYEAESKMVLKQKIKKACKSAPA